MMKSEDEHSFIPLIAPHSSPSIVIWEKIWVFQFSL
jgi:hypothetical protein